ncbi:MAG TPA: 3-dehydroquinate synthase, partial [Blastocatellia bacterium]
PTVDRLYGRRAAASLKRAGFRVQRVLTGDGERFKTLRSAEQLYTFLIQHRIERTDIIVALGGGIVGDLAGFVAATYLRGIKVIQVPTTLLAQIDSSVGGKTGVNHRLGKNLIGAFHQPALVLIDPEVLATLPGRELRSGLFEAIKYGVIKDKGLFERIGLQMSSLKAARVDEMMHLIVRSCEIKAEVVGQDEREGGLRRILNFGHTIGHALEAVTVYRRFLHGEAVGYGMRGACRIAEMMGLFSSDERECVEEVIKRAGRLPAANNLASRDIMTAMKLDKKVQAGSPVFVLPVEIGRVIVSSDVPLKTVRAAVNEIVA